MEEIKILYIKYYTKIQYQLVQKYNPIYIYIYIILQISTYQNRLVSRLPTEGWDKLINIPTIYNIHPVSLAKKKKRITHLSRPEIVPSLSETGTYQTLSLSRGRPSMLQSKIYRVHKYRSIKTHSRDLSNNGD